MKLISTIPDHTTPVDSTFSFLNTIEEEYFEERAAIMQYDGGLSQPDAEEEAFRLLLQRRQQYNLSA